MAQHNGRSSPMIRDLRTDFIKGMLVEDEVSKDPLEQFNTWLEFALKTNDLANAMVLSTVDSSGMPDSRVMLLRDVNKRGLSFFTNYESKKGMDLKKNPKCSLLFFWPELERQVRMSGTVARLSRSESDAYFQSRPFESRVGAHVSKQSQVINGRMEMDELFRKRLQEFDGKEVPRPAHWGGYLFKPTMVEFWQGRASRLHDRLRFVLKRTGWRMERLMP